MFRGTNLLSFTKEFTSDATCKAYLSKIKEKEGFICRKCGHGKYYDGKDYTRSVSENRIENGEKK